MNQLLLDAKELADTHPAESLNLCNQVLNEHFDDEDGQLALFMSGYIMLEAGKYGLAFSIFQRCAQLKPDQAEIYTNLGMCLEESDPDRAILMFKESLGLKPDNPKGWANLALMNLLTGDPIACIAFCKKALELDPYLRAAIHNMGLAQLMIEDFDNGWINYHDTLGVKHREERYYGVPNWNGRDKGRILVYGEQGVGDEMLFASCINDLIMNGHDIVIDCDSRLESLFKNSFDVPVHGTRFSNEVDWLEDSGIKYQLAIGQLPYFYRRDKKDFPGTPYLNPNAEQMLMYKALFDTWKGEKIGLAWNGGLPGTLAKNRSFTLDDMKPLIDKRNTYINLDYKEPDESRYGLKHFRGVTKKGQDIGELAAMVSQLDLVITCCTTILYVAGAVGTPCLVMVPERPGYRYGITGSIFPWYSSVKLFRQQGEGWETVCKQIKNHIKKQEKK